MLTANPHPTGCGYSILEFAMNIELEEVVQDVSDDALELAAGGVQGGCVFCRRTNLARPWSCY